MEQWCYKKYDFFNFNIEIILMKYLWYTIKRLKVVKQLFKKQKKKKKSKKKANIRETSKNTMLKQD